MQTSEPSVIKQGWEKAATFILVSRSSISSKSDIPFSWFSSSALLLKSTHTLKQIKTLYLQGVSELMRTVLADFF